MESNLGLLITYLFSILLMICLPVALAFVLVKRFKVSWWIILTGVVTYIVSQVTHYPVLNQIMTFLQDGTIPLPADQWIPLFLAVIMGFLAALFQEGFRYFGFFIMRKKAKNIPSAVGLGIGQGGMESIALATFPFWPVFGGVLWQFFQIVFYNPGAQIAKGVSAEQVQYVVEQISSFWAIQWHIGLLPGLERIISIAAQILFSVLVWKAVKKHKFGWFALAFFYHMLIDGVSIFLQYSGWGYWAIDGVMSVFMLANLYLVYYFWKEEAEELEEEGEESDEEDDDDENKDDEEDKQEDVKPKVKKVSTSKFTDDEESLEKG
jgi:uncharacterized membrane protein YhfC